MNMSGTCEVVCGLHTICSVLDFTLGKRPKRMAPLQVIVCVQVSWSKQFWLCLSHCKGDANRVTPEYEDDVVKRLKKELNLIDSVSHANRGTMRDTMNCTCAESRVN